MAIQRLFCVLYLQRAACNTFQTCILNSHQGHAMCRSMVDIQSVTAEIRRRIKRRQIDRRKKPQDKNIMAPITQGGHKKAGSLYCTLPFVGHFWSSLCVRCVHPSIRLSTHDLYKPVSVHSISITFHHCSVFFPVQQRVGGRVGPSGWLYIKTVYRRRGQPGSM